MERGAPFQITPMKNRALFFRSTWRHAAMHPGRCAHRAAKVVPRNDKGAVFLGVDNFCVGLHVCEFACLTVVLCALSRCPAPATQPAVTPPETQAAGQRCTWCRMRNCSVLAAGARTRRARRTPCWQGARHMHDLASFSMAKESPFDFALACLDRLLGRAACLEAKLHSHTPPSSRSTTNSPCRASVAVWLTEMGCPGKNQRIRACSPPAASPLPALAEAPAGNAARQHGRLDTAVHERAAGCPATSVPRTARPSGSAMFSRRTAVMRQASCRRHPALKRSSSRHGWPRTARFHFLSTLGQPLIFRTTTTRASRAHAGLDRCGARLGARAVRRVRECSGLLPRACGVRAAARQCECSDLPSMGAPGACGGTRKARSGYRPSYRGDHE